MLKRLKLAAALPLALAAAPAAASYVYTPGADYETREGDINNNFVRNTTTARRHWYFNGALFGAGPVQLNAISLRFDSIVTPETNPSGVYDLNSSFRVQANSISGLVSNRYADNLVGATTLMEGARVVPWVIGGPVNTTKPWGITLTFDTPFVFDPANGLNTLILDLILPPSPSGAISTVDFVSSSPLSGRVQNLDATAETGSFDGYAPVLRFDVTPLAAAVPEPASWATMLIGFALVGGGLRRRPLMHLAAMI